MNPSEISALIIGAVIALISSLTATLVTSLFNHWLSRRSQRQEKIANLHYLMGKMTADVAKSDESVKVWREQKEHLDHFISLGDENDIVGMTGLLEGLKGRIDELKDENENLEASVVEAATGKILLLNQRRDIILGYDQDEQNKRALAMKAVLSKLDKNELMAIAMEEKPLPDLP
jgi:hypothetical protein